MTHPLWTERHTSENITFLQINIANHLEENVDIWHKISNQTIIITFKDA